ncbi:hypothetical protein [Nannocystis pusilla]|uniref:hypothetical protein n=1 Tax=Nannocystis pusilla TaxID=889268 RepID=UPI003B78D5C7
MAAGQRGDLELVVAGDGPLGQQGRGGARAADPRDRQAEAGEGGEVEVGVGEDDVGRVRAGEHRHELQQVGRREAVAVDDEGAALGGEGEQVDADAPRVAGGIARRVGVRRGEDDRDTEHGAAGERVDCAPQTRGVEHVLAGVRGHGPPV